MTSFEEEERLFQMVHDFIESSESSSSSSSSVPVTSSPTSSSNSLSVALQEILGSVTEAEREVLEGVVKHMKSKRNKEKSNGLKKWLVMKLKRDGFNASLCQTSCVTSLGYPAGDYEYIDIILEDEENNNNNNNKPMRLIVDTDFNSQFELARPTQTYKELTDKLPSIFVGSEHKLNKIISLLCSAAKQSLKARGLHIPPWRTSTYMHSKWLSSTRSSSECHKIAGAKSSFISSSSSREQVLQETRGGNSHGFVTKWAPANPVVKPNRRNFRPGCGLSSQFSNMGINCC